MQDKTNPLKHSAGEQERCQHDISSWQAIDVASLNAKARRRYRQRKAAISAYFTTQQPVQQIAERYHLSAALLLKLAEDCLKLHPDGQNWGYRALVPGANVSATQPTAASAAPNKTDIAALAQEAALSVAVVAQCKELHASQSMKVLSSIPPTPVLLLEESEHGGTGRPPEQNAISRSDLSLYTLPGTEAEESAHAHTVFDTAYNAILNGDEDISVAAADAEADGNSQEVALYLPTPLAVVPDDLATIRPVDLNQVSPTQSQWLYNRTGSVVGKVTRLIQQKRKRKQHKQKWGLYQRLSLAVLLALLVAIVLPLGLGLAAYSIYNTVNNTAHSGINHLMAVKDLLPADKNDLFAALDAKKLQRAQSELKGAENDFMQLGELVNRSDIEGILRQVSPDFTNKLLMARHLVNVALDVSRMGQELCGAGMLASHLLHSSPLAGSSTKPLISVADVATIEGVLAHARYYIDDVLENMQYVPLKDVPVSAKQKAQLADLVGKLPQLRPLLAQAQDLVSAGAWLLGVGHARRFLVQTMDRGELRPGGGFTGQYGILSIKDGRVAPFSLLDVAKLDYAGNGMELGRSAPPEYSSWMNFGNWGLRDSNLSGDYPTTAKINMRVFQEEGGGPVDGDISFTPTFIGHILDTTGPLHISEYNETLTSRNLEERLHYYQQDFGAIAIEQAKTGDYSHSGRKAFTSLVGKMLLDRVRHLPTKQLATIIKGAVRDIQSRDLEIYFANPTAQRWLSDHGYSGAIDHFEHQDGFMVVQANISISKASEFVHTSERDDVTLDAQGGATHHLTITLDYQQTGPVYGFDTYADYIRVYAPQNAQYLTGGGFDSGPCIRCCGIASPVNGKIKQAAALSCATIASDARVCPDGNYELGMHGGFGRPWSVNTLGGPKSFNSDLPGRAMFGGLTLTPKNCTSTISVSWYVPDAVKTIKGHPTYKLLVQKQGGYVPTLELHVDTSDLPAMKASNVKIELAADKVFTLAH